MQPEQIGRRPTRKARPALKSPLSARSPHRAQYRISNPIDNGFAGGPDSFSMKVRGPRRELQAMRKTTPARRRPRSEDIEVTWLPSSTPEEQREQGRRLAEARNRLQEAI